MIKVSQILFGERPSTLIEWFRRRDEIDLDPSYQRRGNLWSKAKRQLLINTFLNNLDMPKIYLADYSYYVDSPLKTKEADKRPESESRYYGVIDGKQRLMAIFEFFRDELLLDNTPVFWKGEQKILRGLSYSNLAEQHPELASRIEKFTPTVMGVVTDDKSEIMELFIRLNLGIHLSGPEKRNAMPGPLPPLFRRIAVHDFFQSVVSFKMDNGQDLNTAAKFLAMEYENDFVNTKRDNLDRFVRIHEKTEEEHFIPYVERVLSTLDQMTMVFNKRDDLLKGQAQVPVYYWFVRSISPDTDAREFIYKFESVRRHIKSLMTKRSRGANVEIDKHDFIDYNSLIRSPDNKENQRGMYRFLMEYYRE